MAIRGNLVLGGREVRGDGGSFRAIDAATGKPLDPPFSSATAVQLREACLLAEGAFQTLAQSAPAMRADFLDAVGANILGLGDELVQRAMVETGLPRPRIEGERSRTVNQLRAFASLLRAGDHAEARIARADPDRQPAPKLDLRLVKVPLGPVAIFAASNFPLAFSVAGGDAAAAFAAGCPVVVKAHSAHPGTSELVARAISRATKTCGLPDGVFALLFDHALDIGQALVADPRIKAVAFTGSRRGGLALMDIAARRPEPIPVYAEMSAINPVILMPAALEARAAGIARDFVAAMTLGAGQFCTNPGLVLALAGPALDRFLDAAEVAVNATDPAAMLTPAIHASYCAGVDALASHPDVTAIARNSAGSARGEIALFCTTGAAFLKHRLLHNEVFGATSLIVTCSSMAELHRIVGEIEGQLTISIHMEPDDYRNAAALIPTLERKAGRIVANGFGTGVEVSPAMVHGGPFPATSDGRSTSVGTLAIDRFQRPLCYQDMPDALLPASLREANPWALIRKEV